MTEVTWLGKDGNLIESVVAVMLSRRYQRAVCIRPSVGDGGIDIQVPSQRGLDIYQVKGYAQNLVTGQKTKIASSFDRVRDYTRTADIAVASWNLVMPLNPTKENMAWFRELTGKSGIECNWLGKNFINGLAAEFPDVTEYYFGDGKDRVLETIRQALAAGGIIRRGNDQDSQRQLSPLEIEPGLLGLFTILNKFDPNYLYAPAITPEMPPPRLDDPRLVFEHTQGEPGRFLTFYVYPKHPPVTDEPMPMVQVLFEFEVGSEAHQAIEKLIRYGAPLVLSSERTLVTAELPGGLGGEFRGGTVSIIPAADGPTTAQRKIRLQIVNPDGGVTAETILRQNPATMGIRREGLRCVSVDEGGCFTLESLFDIGEQTWKLSFEEHDISGRAPAAVLPGLRVLAAFQPPNSFRFAGQYGPADAESMPIPGDSGEINPGLLRLAEAINVIQQYTSVQLKIPALSGMSPLEVHEIMLSAAILRGEAAATHLTRFSVPLPAMPDIDDASGPHNIKAVIPHRITVGSDDVNLGWREFAAHQVVVHLSPLQTGGAQMTLTREGGFLMQYRRADGPPATS